MGVRVIVGILAMLCCCGGVAAERPALVLISIDGLKPEAVLQAQAYGLTLPNLTALVADGVHADAVRGVLPSLTYPSHVTLMTGAAPARHGIVANTTFDPLERNQRGWYWYAEDVALPTLWDAAAAAGLITANVYWPVSVGAHIRYNLPQIWRTGLADDLKLQRALSTPGLEQQLSGKLGRYPGGMEETVAADEVRARFAIELLRRKHPDFITVYLTGLDTEQHVSGPFSAAANQVLQRLDRVVGALRAAAPAGAYVALVSDHGFAAVEHDVNLFAAFLGAGLFSLGDDHKIKDWQAMPWPAGGSAAIMLKDPGDVALRQTVGALLDRLAADPANGIDRLMGEGELAAAGAFPGAAWLVAFKPGFELGYGFAPPLVGPPANRGMHGYPPDDAAMRAAFFLVGPGIAKGRSLGDIDMRSIAPTLAGLLHLTLSGAELPALAID